MIERARRLAPACEALLERASEVLGRDLIAHYASANARASLELNRDVQVGVFVANHLHLVALQAHGGRGDRSLGLSLGEYNHLVHIGALSFEDALRLVSIRGELYDAAPRGLMAAVFPLAIDALEAVVEASRARGVVEIGNYNSPSQHVITGEEAAVRHAIELVESEHYARGVIIEERVPMHCSILRGTAEKFRPHLERAAWRTPSAPYLPNVLGAPIVNATARDFVQHLTEHVYRPVLWRASLEHLASMYPDAVFTETGPREVLYNLLSKRWLGNRKFKTDDRSRPLETLRATAAELSDVA
jgi:[acyl-carrier-protein] S-malonyltransferase